MVTFGVIRGKKLVRVFLNLWIRSSEHLTGFRTKYLTEQGLQGYSRDPGFDQNTVRDSGKRKNILTGFGIRDLTATREAGFAKILGREAGFCCLSVGNSGNRHDPNKRYGGKSESTRRAQNINRKGQLLQKLVFFHAFLGKKKRNSG